MNTILGFTVVEVMTYVALVGILLSPIGIVMTQFYSQIVVASQRTSIAVDANRALYKVNDDLRQGAKIKETNSLSDANAPQGGWQTNSSQGVLIISTPALNASRQVVTNGSTGKPYQNELVYYVTNNQLLKRTIADLSFSANTSKTSCPPQSATAACQPDLLLSDDVSNFNFQLYDSDGSITSLPSNTRSVSLQLKLYKKTNGKTIQNNNAITVGLRNSL